MSTITGAGIKGSILSLFRWECDTVRLHFNWKNMFYHRNLNQLCVDLCMRYNDVEFQPEEYVLSIEFSIHCVEFCESYSNAVFQQYESLCYHRMFNQLVIDFKYVCCISYSY